MLKKQEGPKTFSTKAITTILSHHPPTPPHRHSGSTAAQFLILEFSSTFVDDFVAGERYLKEIPTKPFFNLLSVNTALLLKAP